MVHDNKKEKQGVQTLSSHGMVYVDGLEQDCNNSSVLGIELLLSCTKPVMCSCLSEHIGFPSSDLVNTGLAETLLKF